jgi:hypothetical protein
LLFAFIIIILIILRNNNNNNNNPSLPSVHRHSDNYDDDNDATQVRHLPRARAGAKPAQARAGQLRRGYDGPRPGRHRAAEVEEGGVRACVRACVRVCAIQRLFCDYGVVVVVVVVLVVVVVVVVVVVPSFPTQLRHEAFAHACMHAGTGAATYTTSQTRAR